MQTLFGKNLANQDARIRALEGEVRDAVAIPVEDEVATSTLEIGGDFHDTTQEAGHGQGNKPWVFVWSAMIRTILQRQDVPPALRSAIEAHIAQFPNPKKLSRVIRRCTSKIQKNQKRATITVHIRSKVEPLWDLLLEYLQQHGGEQVEVYEDAAPRGPLIRNMIEQLSALDL